LDLETGPATSNQSVLDVLSIIITRHQPGNFYKGICLNRTAGMHKSMSPVSETLTGLMLDKKKILETGASIP
jgi:hypothetical protein